jgi:benzoyl-CoA reductase/2-hydroxyglutaryl-CoA dehydratase subunit BcrC/BadD/HgdB
MVDNMKIGFTTTIPVEIILAAGHVPVDLNNVFVSHPDPMRFIRRSEKEGYPRSLCSWIKGIYGVARELNPVDMLLIVTEGDCSNTSSMLETFRIKDSSPILTFNYPHNRDAVRLESEMKQLAKELKTTLEAAQLQMAHLISVRQKLKVLDELTWQTGQVTGGENHLWLVSSSDFNGDPQVFEEKLDTFLSGAQKRPPKNAPIRLAFAGVPPIFSDLYDYLDSRGASVVLNEMQRQFSMPNDSPSLVEQYLQYTYPYDVFFRIEDLEREIKRRKVQGLIHYVQTFCHRGIEDIVLRNKLTVPVLTLEGDAPGPLDARTRLRIDIFLEMMEKWGQEKWGQTLC